MSRLNQCLKSFILFISLVINVKYFLSFFEFEEKKFLLITIAITLFLYLLKNLFVQDNLIKIGNLADNALTYLYYDVKSDFLLPSVGFEKLSNKIITQITDLKFIVGEDNFAKLNSEIINYDFRKEKKYLDITVYYNSCYYNIWIASSGQRLIIHFVNTDHLNCNILELSQKNIYLTAELDRYKTILDNINILIWLRNKKGEIIYCNSAYKEVINYTQNNGDSFKEIDKFSKSFDDNVINEKSNKTAERYIIIKGKRLLYSFNSNYVKNNDLLVSSAFDMSSKDTISQELQRSIIAQSDLLESTSNACVIFGPDRTMQFYNQAFAKLWELDEIWLNTKPKYEYFLDKLRDYRKLPEQANYASFKREQIELFTNLTEIRNDFFYLPDGRSLRVIIIPHAFGGLLFSYEDMTDRIALESSYNTLIDVQKATLDNLHEGICVFEESGRLKIVNPTFCRMWKCDFDILNSSLHISDLMEKTKDLYINSQNLDLHKKNLMRTFNARVSISSKIERSDGSTFSRIIVPLPDGAILLSDLDITDSIVVERSLREKNIALQNADKIKTEFLANVSYELRSPLTSILGLGELMASNLMAESTPKHKQYATDITRAAEKLIMIINDMIDITSINAGYIDLNISEFNIKYVLDICLDKLKSLIEDMNINVKIVGDDNNLIILGDHNRIHQVIYRLIIKAIDYASNGGFIEITMFKEDDHVVFSVKDNGPGFPETEHDFLFNKFYYSSHNNKHSGLCLSVIKSFIEMHGGNISLKSNKGEGSIFTCKIPQKNAKLVSMYHGYAQENELIDV